MAAHMRSGMIPPTGTCRLPSAQTASQTVCALGTILQRWPVEDLAFPVCSAREASYSKGDA